MKQYREELRQVKIYNDPVYYYFHRWIIPPDPLEGNVRGIVESSSGACFVIDIDRIKFIDGKAEDKRTSEIKRMDDELSQDNKVQADFDEV